MRNALLLLSICLLSYIGFAQHIPSHQLLSSCEDSLSTLSGKIFKGKNDAEKQEANHQFISILERALKADDSFNYSFDALTSIARLTSPDKTFKIYNWNLPREDGTHEYFGFLQTYDKKKKQYHVFPLIDKSTEIKNPENYTGDHNNWYGMLYYKIILKQYKKKTYYTLLAWDGNDQLTTKKIIDVLSFNNSGTPKFGDAIFVMNKKYPKRIIFEYSSNSTMSLKYNETLKMIVFDYLVPIGHSKALEGQYQYYGPSLNSFDAFNFQKGKWVYLKDIDVTKPQDNNDNFYNKPIGSMPEAPLLPR